MIIILMKKVLIKVRIIYSKYKYFNYYYYYLKILYIITKKEKENIYNNLP